MKLPFTAVTRRKSDVPSPSDIEPSPIVSDVVVAFWVKVTSAVSVCPATTSATSWAVTLTYEPCVRSRLTVAGADVERVVEAADVGAGVDLDLEGAGQRGSGHGEGGGAAHLGADAGRR